MDITRFHAAFFEESRENLDAMEAGLLAMESGSADGETINVVFRAAHSIKGGAATFGFTSISELTHQLETLLDEARSGRRQLDADAIGALLVSGDALRGLLAAAEHGDPIDDAGLKRAHDGLAKMMGREVASSTKTATVKEPEIAEWRIGFKPAPSLFLSGNDPLRILRELAGHGELGVTALDNTLPKFSELDPYEAYIAWDLMLPGSVPRSAIDDAFAWVEDQCELAIEGIPATSAVAPPPSPLESDNVVALDTRANANDARKTSSADAGDTSIRVAVNKVDALINLVGELVITQAMLRQRSTQLDPVANELLLSGLELLDRNTRDLQEAVMGVRMLPVEFAAGGRRGTRPGERIFDHLAGGARRGVDSRAVIHMIHMIHALMHRHVMHSQSPRKSRGSYAWSDSPAMRGTGRSIGFGNIGTVSATRSNGHRGSDTNAVRCNVVCWHNPRAPFA